MADHFHQKLQAEVQIEKADEIMTHHLAGFRPLEGIGMIVLIAGFLAAFLVGLLACTWMIRLVKKSQLKYFSFYCFAVGIIAIIFSLV